MLVRFEAQIEAGILPFVPVNGVDGDPAKLVAHPARAKEHTKLQTGELIHVGEGEHRQIDPLHLAGAAVEEGSPCPFHLIGRGQVDTGQEIWTGVLAWATPARVRAPQPSSRANGFIGDSL